MSSSTSSSYPHGYDKVINITIVHSNLASVLALYRYIHIFRIVTLSYPWGYEELVDEDICKGTNRQLK